MKTALLSNVHAIRRYDEYFLPLKDILWLIDKTRKSDQIKDMPIDVPLCNLFDGVLAFTESDARDEFVAKLFEMDSVRLA